jgi:hypothetical protein
MKRINKNNTLFFGEDLEYLLMVKDRVVDYIDTKSMYSYHSIIWADEKGWYLTINVYRNDDLKLIE